VADDEIVRLRWHVVAGDQIAPTLRVDCDSAERADTLLGLYRRRHPDVRLVTVVHRTSAALAVRRG